MLLVSSSNYLPKSTDSLHVMKPNWTISSPRGIMAQKLGPAFVAATFPAVAAAAKVSLVVF
jgi:hypothetical protein